MKNKDLLKTQLDKMYEIITDLQKINNDINKYEVENIKNTIFETWNELTSLYNKMNAIGRSSKPTSRENGKKGGRPKKQVEELK